MVRLATHTDCPDIAQGLLELVPRTGWAMYKHGVTYQDVLEFVTNRLVDPSCVLYVYDGGAVTAFCGASLSQLYVPPYHKTVYEWGWYGPPRQAALVWQAAKAWGKRHGAKLAGYISAKPGTSVTTIHEPYIWKVL